MIRPLYKSVEPFMEVRRGFGFQGVIQYDDQEDKIQCHICGKWFKNLGTHSSQTHHQSPTEYKIAFGLRLGTPLVNQNISSKLSTSRTLTNSIKGSGVFLKNHKPIGGATKNRRRASLYAKNTMQFRNKNGLCDLQLRHRYSVVKQIVKHDPMEKDIRKYDMGLYAAIIGRCGGLNSFRVSIGVPIKHHWDYSRISEISVIAALRKFAKVHKRKPSTSDFLKGFDGVGQKVVYRHFGSWGNALATAGLK